MPRKVTKKAAGEKPKDIGSFMANLAKISGVENLSDKVTEFYKTGDYTLDAALYGGIPKGAVVELFGKSSTGKSLFALQIAREAVATYGENVLYFDTESKISEKAFKKYGLYGDERCQHLTIDTLENAFDVLQQAIESDMFKLLVVDSVDALTTNEQEDRDINEGSKVGGYKAKVLSENLGKLTRSAALANCTIVFVRQVRDNPNAMYGNPEVTSGGRALEFYDTVRLRFSPNKEGNQEVGGRLVYQGAKVTVVKENMGALPSDPVAIRYYIGDEKDWGVDKVNSVFAEAKRLNILAPQTATSHKYVPCDALCKMLDLEPSELSYNGKGAAMAGIQGDEVLFDAICELIDKADGKPYVNGADDGDDDAEVGFEEIDD